MATGPWYSSVTGGMVNQASSISSATTPSASPPAKAAAEAGRHVPLPRGAEAAARGPGPALARNAPRSPGPAAARCSPTPH
jgi:hypothetical protein